MDSKNEISLYFENIALILLGIFLLAFPLVFTTQTTDPFGLPKQILLGGVTLITLLLLGARMVSDAAVRLRRTPFDTAVIAFGLIIFLSTLFAVNRFDSIIGFAPILFAIVLYFVIINFAKNKSSVLFLVGSLVLGGTIVGALATLSYLKIYILPMVETQAQNFTPFGNVLDQALYLALVLPVALYFVVPYLMRLTGTKSGEPAVFATGESKIRAKSALNAFLAALASIIILSGLFVSVYQLFKPVEGAARANFLPFETGFQTAFAAISQDPGRTVPGFLLGSGYNTYVVDFTRFKQASFNADSDLWALNFFRSTSYILELLATVGVLGVAAFAYLLLTILKEIRSMFSKDRVVREGNPLLLAVMIVFIGSLLLPFSFTIQAMLFIILALFAASQGLIHPSRFFDIELHFVAFRRSLIPFQAVGLDQTISQTKDERHMTKFLPVTFFLAFTLFAAIFGFLVYRYATSDLLFQNSLVAASNNNGLQTYNDQTNAIRIFPYRSEFYRVYSQVNLNLANSLAASIPQGSSPSSEMQQTITTLIQQSINSGRTATTLSPQFSPYWQSLSGVYRSLIGFGQNAQQFAIATQQQAVALDPNNPQQYVSLGGIYYQLGAWDEAQRQFQIAANLKPDYANAYYNLGHALEQKGELQLALQQYQTVRTLVANDKNNLSIIDKEIQALQARIGQQAQTPTQTEAQAAQTPQQPLQVNQPQTQLPERKPEVRIPGPDETPTPTPTRAPSPTPEQ